MARKKVQQNDGGGGAPGWMATYADLMSLLLCFFVLLVAFSNMDQIKFAMAANSLKGALGVMKRYPSQLNNLAIEVTSSQADQRKGIYESVFELQDKIAEMGLEDQVHVEFTENGLLIQMGDKILFDVGKANLRPEAYPVLDLVGRTIRTKAGEVLVSGHTDNIPINTAEFQSNWELSSARALIVVKYMIDKAGVPPTILGATGYSEFRPVAPNDNAVNRQRNRRVEFLVTWR